MAHSTRRTIQLSIPLNSAQGPRDIMSLDHPRSGMQTSVLARAYMTQISFTRSRHAPSGYGYDYHIVRLSKYMENALSHLGLSISSSLALSGFMHLLLYQPCKASFGKYGAAVNSRLSQPRSSTFWLIRHCSTCCGR
jgi:hypothetical protein